MMMMIMMTPETCVHTGAGYYSHYIIIKPGVSLGIIKTHWARPGISRELLCQQSIRWHLGSAP